MHSIMYWKQWHMCLRVYKSIQIQSTYFVTLKVHLGACSIWSLLCIIKHLTVPSAVTNLSKLDALECSHSWCVCTVHSILTGNVVVHQVCAQHSWITNFNVTTTNQCILFNIGWPEGVPNFTSGMTLSASIR